MPEMPYKHGRASGGGDRDGEALAARHRMIAGTQATTPRPGGAPGW
jgi:hypothetical protein